jgi:ParB-like chromosome segregation protein Spo0J
MSALRGLGELAFVEPLTITRDRTIIDGHARWELAKELKRPVLTCLEYDLSETEALEWLLQKHRRSNGLNDYSRIMRALDLEPELADRLVQINRSAARKKVGQT